jgi:hypothetical protein
MRCSHAKRKYEDIADQWPIACAGIRALIGELYAIERLDPRAYLLRAVYAAIGRPGTVRFPEDLLASTLTG